MWERASWEAFIGRQECRETRVYLCMCVSVYCVRGHDHACVRGLPSLRTHMCKREYLQIRTNNCVPAPRHVCASACARLHTCSYVRLAYLFPHTSLCGGTLCECLDALERRLPWVAGVAWVCVTWWCVPVCLIQVGMPGASCALAYKVGRCLCCAYAPLWLVPSVLAYDRV